MKSATTSTAGNFVDVFFFPKKLHYLFFRVHKFYFLQESNMFFLCILISRIFLYLMVVSCPDSLSLRLIIA